MTPSHRRPLPPEAVDERENRFGLYAVLSAIGVLLSSRQHPAMWVLFSATVVFSGWGVAIARSRPALAAAGVLVTATLVQVLGVALGWRWMAA